MDSGLKQKWVAALRSGNYEQGKRRLQTDEHRFCCLGVLCDIINPDGWKLNLNCYAFQEYIGFVPHELREQIALSYDDMTTLGSMNDNGNNFNTIADYIEKNL